MQNSRSRNGRLVLCEGIKGIYEPKIPRTGAMQGYKKHI